MLTLMIAHVQHNKIVSEKLRETHTSLFTAKKMTHKGVGAKVNMYREMCRKEFGTFDLGSIDSLLESSFTENDIERRVLHSEILAGNFIIGHKTKRGGNYLEPSTRPTNWRWTRTG